MRVSVLICPCQRALAVEELTFIVLLNSVLADSQYGSNDEDVFIPDNDTWVSSFIMCELQSSLSKYGIDRMRK